MEYKTIKTNDVYTKDNWDNFVKKIGGWNSKCGSVCHNINLKNLI